MSIFQQGEQIVYVPTHAQQKLPAWSAIPWTFDLDHPDIEFGFVTSQRGDTVFCRYWRKGHLGDLRTKANSEGTPVDCLARYESVSADTVAHNLQWIEDQHWSWAAHSND
jgi:hypothetical protein